MKFSSGFFLGYGRTNQDLLFVANEITFLLYISTKLNTVLDAAYNSYCVSQCAESDHSSAGAGNAM